MRWLIAGAVDDYHKRLHSEARRRTRHTGRVMIQHRVRSLLFSLMLAGELVTRWRYSNVKCACLRVEYQWQWWTAVVSWCAMNELFEFYYWTTVDKCSDKLTVWKDGIIICNIFGAIARRLHHWIWILKQWYLAWGPPVDIRNGTRNHVAFRKLSRQSRKTLQKATKPTLSRPTPLLDHNPFPINKTTVCRLLRSFAAHWLCHVRTLGNRA